MPWSLKKVSVRRRQCHPHPRNQTPGRRGCRRPHHPPPHSPMCLRHRHHRPLHEYLQRHQLDFLRWDMLGPCCGFHLELVLIYSRGRARSIKLLQSSRSRSVSHITTTPIGVVLPSSQLSWEGTSRKWRLVFWYCVFPIHVAVLCVRLHRGGVSGQVCDPLWRSNFPSFLELLPEHHICCNCRARPGFEETRLHFRPASRLELRLVARPLPWGR